MTSGKSSERFMDGSSASVKENSLPIRVVMALCADSRDATALLNNTTVVFICDIAHSAYVMCDAATGSILPHQFFAGRSADAAK